MALTITSDIIIDEELRATQTGTADDDDVSLATFDASAFKTALASLSLSYVTSPTGFPQYAEQQSFVSSANQVTNYFLTGSLNGDPLPPEGTATDLYVGSNQIFLFATSDSDIIVGRIGNGAIADPTGDVAFVIGIEENKTGSVVDSADLWIALYAPVVQDGENLVDSADQLSLDNLVYIGSTYDTTTNIPFENFNGVPSGNNLFNVIFPSDGSSAVQLLLTGSVGETLSTVNVSTTGIGAGSQHIDVGATLRIDTVQGMTQSSVDDPPEVNNANNIVYTDTGDPGTDPRVELVAADFEVTQLNPGSAPARVTILVSAYNAVGGAQQGAYLTDAIANDGVQVQIDAADVIVLNGAGLPATGVTVTQQGDSVLIEGLDDGTSGDKTDGYQVFFTTDGVHFDRILITNMDPDGTTLDVGNIHVTAVEGGIDTEYLELGDRVKFQDDGPKIIGTGLAAPNVIADDTTLGTNPTGDFSVVFGTKDYGADGKGADSYVLGVKSANVASGLFDTASGQSIVLSYDAVTNKVFGKTAGSGLTVFEISVSASGIVTLDQQRAIQHTDSNDFNSSAGLSAADLITLSLVITDSEAADHNDSASQTVNIAGAFAFLDDGPVIAGSPDVNAPNDLVVKNLTTAAGQDASSYVLTPGADGLKSFSILGPQDTNGDFTWQYFNVDGLNGIESNEIRGSYKGNALYTLEVENDGSYVFKMIGTIPNSTLNLTADEIKAGGPDTNSILVGAIENDNYVEIAGGGGPVNESHGFVGVKNGNLDVGESLTFKLYDQIDGNPGPDPAVDTLLPFQGIVIGSKSAQTSVYHVVATPLGGGTAYEADITVLKNQPLTIDPPGDGLYTEVTITKISGSALKIGVGDIDILVPPSDVTLSFTLRETDGDNDFVDASFNVSIDGNNDGSITNPVTASFTVDDVSLLAAATPVV